MQTTMHILLDGWLGGGRMMGAGRGFFFFPGGLLMIFSTIALILLLIWAIRAWSGNRQSSAIAGAGAGGMNISGVTAPAMTASATPRAETPLAVLQMRYANGEISRAEYETIRQDLLGDRPEQHVAPAVPTATATEA